MFNPLLQRQIRETLGTEEAIPDELVPLLDAINRSYDQYQIDRTLTDRSMNIRRNELTAANRQLVQESEHRAIVLKKLKKSLATLQLEQINGTARPNGNDDPVYLADLLQRQIEQRKLAEEELRATNSRLLALVENLEAGVLVNDEHGRIVVINQIFCDMFGLSNDLPSLLGTRGSISSEDVKHLFVDPEEFIACSKQRLQDRQPVTGDELNLADGRTYERDYIPIIVDRQYHGHLWQFRDISERKRAERSIRQLNRQLVESNRLLRIERDSEKEHVRMLERVNLMKSEFVSSVSHELRTPLASIIGFAQTILMEPELPAEVHREFLQIVLDEGKRLSKLINDILDLARIESGRAIVEKSPTDLVPLIERALYSIAMQAEAKSISIASRLEQPSMIASFDADRISQVIINLLGNALKFTPAGGQITVYAAFVDTEVEVRVSDTGMGIPEGEIPMLFQKFYRVHRPGLEIRGTGLGLAIVRQLVELHNGTISVESGVDRGSTFTIRIPRE
jgi:PAS domain S-box-containing protein